MRSRASGPISQTELIPFDFVGSRHVGFAVAIDGNTAVVGAPLDADTGSVYVFVRAGSVWSQQAKLIAGDAAIQSQFGTSVGISGDTIVIGAPFASTAGVAGGAAYIFVRSGSTWTQQARLAPGDAVGNELFGSSVALDGDTLAVGASGAGGTYSGEGAVYIYARGGGGWTQQARLRSAAPGSYNSFGSSVALSHGSLAVGAPFDDANGIRDGGAVYLFVGGGSTWSLQSRLNASDTSSSDQFGSSVALDGDTVVAGAPQNESTESLAGAAYVFVRNGAVWSQQAKLVGNDSVMFDFFGFSVAVRGDLVVIGSVLDSTFAFNGGAAYLFTRAQNVWSQDSEFSAGNLGEDYHFGFSVALDHATVLVGAPSGSSMDEGTAYAFALAPSNTAPLATSQSVTTSEDATVPIILSGSDPEGDPLTYTVLSAPLKGTLTGTPPNLSYTPDANANGSDSFTFKVKDGELDSAPASVSINIVPENDRPAISSLSEQTIDENSTTGPIAFAVTDVDNDPASLIVSKSSDNPALVPDSSISLTSGTDRTVTVTPAANQFGAATITLTVSDGLMIAQTSFVLNVRQANLPPVADASATPTRVISANNVDAVVTLDGSRSHDPASDPLAFTWFEGGNIIGAGVVSRRTLAVGTHAITLTVSDGANSESTTVSVRVMTLAQSIYELIAAVQAANIAQDEKSALIATLQAAANSCARGNLNAAVNQLWTFVSKVNAQTGKAIDSATASELVTGAQDVSTIITGGSQSGTAAQGKGSAR